MTWNNPGPDVVNEADGSLVYGPVTTPALCRMNSLVVSAVFRLLNDNTIFGPTTDAPPGVNVG